MKMKLYLKILKIVFSYIDYVNRTVWKKIILLMKKYLQDILKLPKIIKKIDFDL